MNCDHEIIYTTDVDGENPNNPNSLYCYCRLEETLEELRVFMDSHSRNFANIIRRYKAMKNAVLDYAYNYKYIPPKTKFQ